MSDQKPIQKLDGFDLDVKKDCFDRVDEVRITERNLTAMVEKLNEVIDRLNESGGDS